MLPVRDERRRLPEQLSALAAQTYDGDWELIVVDDASRDGSGDVARGYAGVLPGLRVIEVRPHRGLNHARNAGVAAARGEVVAFCDADDVVTPGWLAALVAALDEHGADIVAGSLELDTLNSPVQHAWRNRARWDQMRLRNGLYAYVPGGNLAIRAEAAREVGWDERFVFGSSDAEFAWRAQHHGLKVAHAPGAVIRLRYPETIGELARQFYGYGAGEPLLYARERHRGFPRSRTTNAVREYVQLVLQLPNVLGTPQRRGWWVRRAAYRLGRLRGSLRARVLYL